MISFVSIFNLLISNFDKGYDELGWLKSGNSPSLKRPYLNTKMEKIV